MQEEKKKIFVDTDFISSFLRVEEFPILKRMYPDYLIVVPHFVKEEIMVRMKFLKHLQNRFLIELGNRDLIENPPLLMGSEEAELYIRLNTIGDSGLRVIGKGEAEAIALTKVRGGILASNNLKDVSCYVALYNLEHITTADVLLRAYKEYYLDKDRVNQIWSDMIALKRKLPFETFDEYLKSEGE